MLQLVQHLVELLMPAGADLFNLDRLESAGQFGLFGFRKQSFCKGKQNIVLLLNLVWVHSMPARMKNGCLPLTIRGLPKKIKGMLTFLSSL